MEKYLQALTLSDVDNKILSEIRLMCSITEGVQFSYQMVQQSFEHVY
jgi:hypothetical protein